MRLSFSAAKVVTLSSSQAYTLQTNQRGENCGNGETRFNEA